MISSMKLIPKETGIVDLCYLLGVTPAWIGKTMRELNMPMQGRGRKRVFSEGEFQIFKNIKLLRLCEISWSEIKEARRRDEKAARHITSYINKLWKDHESPLNGDSAVYEAEIEFTLSEPLHVKLADFIMPGKSHSESVTVSDQQKRIYEILSENKTKEIVATIEEGIRKVREELTDFESLKLYEISKKKRLSKKDH